MTWYEWGLESWRILDEDERVQRDHNLLMEIMGQFMAQHWNLTVDLRKNSPKTRKDYFKLNYDTILTEDVDPELFQKVARRLGGTIKRKDGGDK